MLGACLIYGRFNIVGVDDMHLELQIIVRNERHVHQSSSGPDAVSTPRQITRRNTASRHAIRPSMTPILPYVSSTAAIANGAAMRDRREVVSARDREEERRV